MYFRFGLIPLCRKLMTGRLLIAGIGISSFIWLVIVVPFLSLHNDGVRPFFSPQNKGNQDLAHYYMGGAIFLERSFDALYPEPNAEISSNLGWPDASTAKPLYQAIAKDRGVEDSFRYILTPPTTMLLAPLAIIPYPVARWVWVIIMGLSSWGVCCFSYHMGLRIGLPRWVGGLWWAVWAFSPLMLKTLRTANSTPLVAIALAMSALGIYENKKALAICSCIVAGLLKGTSLIFAPFILIMRRWGLLAGGAAVVIFINVVMLLMAGTEIYREFFEVVYPSTRITDPFYGNQSVYGFLYRVGGNEGMTPIATLMVKIVFFTAMSGLLIRLWSIRRQLCNDFALYINAVLGLLGVYLIFGAYCWDHYVLFYLPFWHVLWGRSRCLWKILCLLGFVALVWIPLSVIRGGALVSGEPLQSHMLWGQLLLIAVAVSNLFAREQEGWLT